MIIVQLKGGFGNQLFQYAAALGLAAHHRTGVKVDITALNKRDDEIMTYRSFDLQALKADPAAATENEINKVKQQAFPFNLIDKLRPPHRRKIYKESSFYFDPHFFNAGDDIYLKGYRQSEKYFANIREEIIAGFQLKTEFIEPVKEKAALLASEKSIALHIRRGDYTNTVVRDYHGILDPGYYQQAIEFLETQMGDCRFYVFTDDQSWVEQSLVFSRPAEMVSGKISHSHFEDFYLMSQCKHQVIANSTFSWWAAWLNPNPDKLVIAPKKWFNNAPYDTRDLIPESWIKI